MPRVKACVTCEPCNESEGKLGIADVVLQLKERHKHTEQKELEDSQLNRRLCAHELLYSLAIPY